jgi:coatomer subunit beta
VFGEDALVNVSVERVPGSGPGGDGARLVGYIRIRSKTQVRAGRAGRAGTAAG